MEMLIDMFFSLVSTVLSGLVNVFIPFVNFTIPTGGLTWLTGSMASAGQIFPVSTWFAMLGILLPLRLGYLLWKIAVFIYDRIPVLGHGAL